MSSMANYKNHLTTPMIAAICERRLLDLAAQAYVAEIDVLIADAVGDDDGATEATKRIEQINLAIGAVEGARVPEPNPDEDEPKGPDHVDE